MAITVQDRSNYFKALLILIGKDRIINAKEVELMKLLGKIFDFDSSFVNESVRDLLGNEYITEEPPKFRSQNVAEAFVKDSAKFILSDNSIESREYKWLLEVASKNGLNRKFCDDVLNEYRITKNASDKEILFEISKIFK